MLRKDYEFNFNNVTSEELELMRKKISEIYNSMSDRIYDENFKSEEKEKSLISVNFIDIDFIQNNENLNYETTSSIIHKVTDLLKYGRNQNVLVYMNYNNKREKEIDTTFINRSKSHFTTLRNFENEDLNEGKIFTIENEEDNNEYLRGELNFAKAQLEVFENKVYIWDSSDFTHKLNDNNMIVISSNINTNIADINIDFVFNKKGEIIEQSTDTMIESKYISNLEDFKKSRKGYFHIMKKNGLLKFSK